LIASADDAPDVCSPNILDNIGAIEIIVLRCAGTRNTKTASAMNMDGANDFPGEAFGFDGQSRQSDGRSTYDDRGPFFNGLGDRSGPPPPVPNIYRSPYAETVPSQENASARSRYSTHVTSNPSPLAPTSHHSRPQSRYSEPVSPGARPSSSIPSAAYQYGSGPIPHGPMHGSERSFYHSQPGGAVVANAPGVDPAWLNQPTPEIHNQHVDSIEIASQFPGAWPASPSPYSPGVPPAQLPVTHIPPQTAYHNGEARGTAWHGSQPGWTQPEIDEKSKTHVAWDEEPGWDSHSNAGSWGARGETTSDNWDTDDTWGKKPEQRPTKSHSNVASQRASSATNRTRDKHHSRDDRSRRSRSKSRARTSTWKGEAGSSSEDRDGWAHVGTSSDPPTTSDSTDETVRASQSRSQVPASRSRSLPRKTSRRTKSIRNGDRRLSQPMRGGDDAYATSMFAAPAPSIRSEVTPIIMNAPLAIFTPQAPSHKASTHTGPVAPFASPQSGWGSESPAKPRKHSKVDTYIPLAPFGVPLNGLVQDNGRSTSSSSWGSKEKKGPSKPHRKAESSQSVSWGSGRKNDKAAASWSDNGLKNASKDVDSDIGWGATNTGGTPGDNQGGTKTQDAGWDTGDDDWTNDPSKSKNGKEKTGDNWDTDNDAWNTTNPADAPWDFQDDNDWKNKPDNIVHWDPNSHWSPAPIPAPPTELEPAKAASTSKRHTTKSLSKYRQLRSSSDVGPKPHWQFPPPPTTIKKLHSISEDATLPAEPLLKIPQSVASEKGLEHQVRAGKGTSYGHAVGRPEYLDTLDKPYAVFRFKYRSRAVLKSMFGDAVPDHGHLSRSTPASKAAREKEKLKDVSKDELIEKMIKLQSKLVEKKDGGERKREVVQRRESQSTESVARGLTANWVKQHSRDVSEKGKKGGDEKVKVKEKQDDEGWSAADDGGNWDDATW
jgi:hypothetical protein